jgi:hypothetical protein
MPLKNSASIRRRSERRAKDTWADPRATDETEPKL